MQTSLVDSFSRSLKISLSLPTLETAGRPFFCLVGCQTPTRERRQCSGVLIFPCNRFIKWQRRCGTDGWMDKQIQIILWLPWMVCCKGHVRLFPAFKGWHRYTVTGKNLAHFFSNFLWAALGEGGQFWNGSILWNGVLQLHGFSTGNNVIGARKPLKISLRKKSGSWRTPFHKIDPFQNWSYSPTGATNKFEKYVQDFCPSLYKTMPDIIRGLVSRLVWCLQQSTMINTCTMRQTLDTQLSIDPPELNKMLRLFDSYQRWLSFQQIPRLLYHSRPFLKV